MNEREFLKLAGVWLSCRWVVWGNEIEDNPYRGSLEFALLGMLDYAAEMRLLVAESQCQRVLDADKRTRNPTEQLLSASAENSTML